MQEQINTLVTAFSTETSDATSTEILNNIKVKYLGKSGLLTAILRGMKDLSPEERPKAGKWVNDAREHMENIWEAKRLSLAKSELEAKMALEKIDITIPAKKGVQGGLHPQTIVRNQIIDIFLQLGYTIEDGREIETDYYNFEALNVPFDHPARAMQDTFYVGEVENQNQTNFVETMLLRTQTSTTQIHKMESLSNDVKNPNFAIKMLNPGRVYRADEIDATHSPMFHQVEGLVVDKNINMCHLKGTLDYFVRQFFGADTKTRLRPSYFPFTEPSIEVDATCAICKGKGCRVCKGTGWIEILGAGIVNKKVLDICGIDSKIYSGFAFGMGIDRITNIKFGITDLRVVFENDIRFIKQFN